MTDAEKDELISDAGEIVHYLREIITGPSDLMKAMFALVKVAVKAEEWHKKRARFVERDRKQEQEQQP